MGIALIWLIGGIAFEVTVCVSTIFSALRRQDWHIAFVSIISLVQATIVSLLLSEGEGVVLFLFLQLSYWFVLTLINVFVSLAVSGTFDKFVDRRLHDISPERRRQLSGLISSISIGVVGTFILTYTTLVYR